MDATGLAPARTAANLCYLLGPTLAEQIRCMAFLKNMFIRTGAPLVYQPISFLARPRHADTRR